MEEKVVVSMKKYIIPFIRLFVFLAVRMSAQQTPNAQKTDSIVANLPQLIGKDRLDALLSLINFTAGLPAQKAFTFQYLDEARQ